MRSGSVIAIILFCLRTYAERPDTSRIPEKWKHESVIVLEHFYEVREQFFENTRFKITNRIVYYIRDKEGLQDLSTFNIPTYIVPGAEMQIGKVYKKNNETIDLTTRHLIPMHMKVDFGNRRKRKSQYEGESGQKLAIPNLEVGDILEINYISNMRENINYLYLNLHYNTIKSEVRYEVNNQAAGRECQLQFKAINFPAEQVQTITTRLLVEREFVEKTKEESLADKNYINPYIIAWKSCNGLDVTQAVYEISRSRKYEELADEEARAMQEQLSDYLFPLNADTAVSNTGDLLKKILSKKYKDVKDTLQFLNDLFYLCRELRGLSGLNSALYSSTRSTSSDRFFMDIYSGVLLEFGIPFKTVISQYDYYGKLETLGDYILPRYALMASGKNYFLFNPFLSAFPNTVPLHLQGQAYVYYTNYKSRFSGKKKKVNYQYFKGRFPESSADENGYSTEMHVSKLDLDKKTFDCNFSASFNGNRKESFADELCSNSFAYEKQPNAYRSLAAEFTGFPEVAGTAEHERRLMNFIREHLNSEGFKAGKIRSCAVQDLGLFSSTGPLKVSAVFTQENAFTSADNYLILEVKKLIGSQLFYKEQQQERRTDFHIACKRQYSYSVTVDIPKGYALVQNGKQNRVVTTEAGSVSVKTEMKDNQLQVSLVKTYNFKALPREKLTEVTSFLDAATDFYNSRILLVKQKQD